MSNAVDDAIVRRDLLTSLVFVGVGWSVSTIAWSPDWVAIAAVVAAVSFLLGAAADRSDAGLWVLLGTGTVVAIALVLSTLTNSLPVATIGPSILGIAVGTGVNRLLFGVMNPVPGLRRRREATD
ncbi:hypothetical protein [Haloarchaeobius salinus]|uniref:hypothetical protein n=1 Tax=Haloarchaeobius salinus TaxID=1198298 RepID=UPI002109566D|nr:hypothetical protein [Haloarchaeobius salinus]